MMTPEEKAIRDAAIIAKRQKEIKENIAWWKQQEQWRMHGFNIESKDTLFPARPKCPTCKR